MGLKKADFECIAYENEDKTVVGSVLLTTEKKVLNIQIHIDIISNKSSIREVEEFLEIVREMEWVKK